MISTFTVRLLQFLIVTVSFAIFAAAASASVKALVTLTAQEQNWIRQHPVFRIGAFSLPPYIVLQFSVNSTCAIMLKMGVDIQAF